MKDSGKKIVHTNVSFNVATKINSLTMHSYEVRMNGIEIDRIELTKNNLYGQPLQTHIRQFRSSHFRFETKNTGILH